MLEQSFTAVYTKFKLNFYRSIFSRFETREASLTAVETFCVEVIHALGRPTINEFAQFVQISQANATYKIQSLIKKEYIKKERSKLDKREYILSVTDKFHRYYDVSAEYIDKVMQRIQGRLSPEDLKIFSSILNTIADELMPEVPLLPQK